MNAAQLHALGKIRKCLDLANDARGNPTMRETARRQAQALIAKHGLHLDKIGSAAAPAEPTLSSPDWAPYWAKRTTAEAMRAGVRTTVLCADGFFVPG